MCKEGCIMGKWWELKGIIKGMLLVYSITAILNMLTLRIGWTIYRVYSYTYGLFTMLI